MMTKRSRAYTIKGSGIYYLKERHYNDEFGLSLDETSDMTFLNY